MKLHAVWKYWCFITFMKLISKVGIIPFNISFQSTEVGWWDLNKSKHFLSSANLRNSHNQKCHEKPDSGSWRHCEVTLILVLHVYFFFVAIKQKWLYLSWLFNQLSPIMRPAILIPSLCAVKLSNFIIGKGPVNFFSQFDNYLS